MRLSPSSINIQPWQFFFVQDETLKAKLAEASLHNLEKVNQADLLVVFSVAENLEKFQEVVDREQPEALRNWYNQIKSNTPEADLKTWFAKQVYIALGMGLAGSAALGLDATPMEGINKEQYAEILNSTDYQPILAMAVGYAAPDDFNRLEVKPKSRRALNDVIAVY